MLTTIGKKQAYALGESLRKKYIDEKGFMSRKFNKDEI